MSYNEYWQLIEAGMRPDQLVVFKYEAEGVATLEDGLYTTEAKLQDPAMVDRLARFLKASMRGWRYAMDHQAEAVKIVMANDITGQETPDHQTRMMSEVAKLLGSDRSRMGYLSLPAYDRTVRELMSGASDPVITRKPEGAWTRAVWDKAFLPATRSQP